MNTAELAAQLEQARRWHQAGNFADAEQAYRDVLAQAPDAPGVRRDLAWLCFQTGRREQAIEQMQALAEANPGQSTFWCDLGNMYSSLGRPGDAVLPFRKALGLEPGRVDARFNLGNCYRRLGQLDQAAEAYRVAAKNAPDDADIHLNLGVTQNELGLTDAAQASFDRVLALRPASVEAWINKGLVAKANKDYAQAVECYDRAISLDPASAIALNNRASALEAQGNIDAAIADYGRALAIRPNYPLAFTNLANAYLDQGKLGDAVACLERAAAAGAGDAFRIKAALAIAPVIESEAAIERTLARIGTQLDRLSTEPLSVADPVQELGTLGFYLAYQGGNQRDTQARLAHLLRRATPGLEFAAPHCAAAPGASAASRRIRVGFASLLLYNHTIGKLTAGLIQQLDRKRFEVVVFRAAGHDDERSRMIAAAADKTVTLSPQLAAARQQIAGCALDVLYYPDIGMTALPYFLAHARLAPVQCVTWGHPLTTGIPTVDYFISSHDLEPADADAHYTEKLVRLEHLANYYFRPTRAATPKTRADFGLDDQAHLYVCPQSLFKLHPRDDAAWRAILERDPAATIVVVEGPQPAWGDSLRRRQRQSLGELADRVRFVPRQPTSDFLELLALADVLLDPLEFGGGNTSYEAFAFGTPIVTLPGGFLRNRITYALYRAMGLGDCAATSFDDYVDRAVGWGADADSRRATSERILAANHAIYENAAGVRELEAFFASVVPR